MPQVPRSILAIDTSPFGKTLELVPSIRALREAYPDSFIAVAAASGTCQLVAANGIADETIEIGVVRPPDVSQGRAIKRLVTLIRRSRRHRFDLVLDFSPRLETQFVSRMVFRARTIVPARFPRALEMLLGLGDGDRAGNRSNYASVL